MSQNLFLDLAVFPDSPVDPMTLRNFVEQNRQGHSIQSARKGREFILTYRHKDEQGEVMLKIRGRVSEQNLGFLLPAPVAVYLYDNEVEAPKKSVTLYKDRPSGLFTEVEGERYMRACRAAWGYISIHSSLRRGDL
ncbi:hypothetical protein C0431_12700 [bacterium]|nr:hypothetical protein [bacterium]